MNNFGPPATRGATVAALTLGLLLTRVFEGPAAPEEPAQALLSRPGTVSELLDRLEAGFQSRDLEGLMGLLELPDEGARQAERDLLRTLFEAEEVALILQRPASVAASATRLRVSGQVFRASEPRARVDQWRFLLEKKGGAWVVTARDDLGDIDGLLHLSLDPRGFRADGLVVRLEDFELRFRRGTLYSSPDNVGPTVLVFVGEGEVIFTPRPAAERQQLRRFTGELELRDEVRAAFLRIHPADLRRVLSPIRFEADPEAASRWRAAERLYRDQVHRYFILDAALPRAPWWLLPGLGDASVTFDTKRRGQLTFAVNASEAEGVSLFDRLKRRQICLYPSGGREPLYSEEDGRAVDLQHLDLSVRFEPQRRHLSGTATLRLRLLQPATTVRLRLDDSFKVESVTSGENVSHLFFRVRGQDSLMISLGPQAGETGDIDLTIRYSGEHEPFPVEEEVLQVVSQAPPEGKPIEGEIFIENVLVYTNRTAWYPRPSLDDHATARLRFDTPLGVSALTGGRRVFARLEGDRTKQEFELDRPAKYVTVAVGRFFEAEEHRGGSLRLHAFGMSRTKSEARTLLERSARILAFYEVQFGPCPYPDLNLLLIEGQAPGGHAPPGMVLLQRRPPLLRNTLRDDPASFPDEPDFFLAHELAHQWWGQAVSGSNYRERWLSEGFAQYAAAMWVKERRGEEAFRNVLARFGCWASRHDEEGPIHLGYRVGHIRGDPQAFRAIVYDKAAYVLHMLRGLMGDAAFFEGLGTFQERHRYGKASSDDLRKALEAASGKDLGPYFQSFIFEIGLPRISYKSRIASETGRFQVDLAVQATGLPGPMPLEVRIDHDGGGLRRQLTVAPGDTRLRIDSPARPRRVELNSDRGLLARIDGR
jgi:hypothetical protein